ncbi:MAG: ferredoxin family protein [Candidatus Hodarchaeota archaeon]
MNGIVVDSEICIGCNRCVDGCPMDVLFPSEKPGAPPIIRYPDECWYCGSCYMVCPTEPPAIDLVHPLNMRLALRRVK